VSFVFTLRKSAHALLLTETWVRWSCDQWEGSWLADFEAAILGNTYTYSTLQEVWGK